MSGGRTEEKNTPPGSLAQRLGYSRYTVGSTVGLCSCLAAAYCMAVDYNIKSVANYEVHLIKTVIF